MEYKSMPEFYFNHSQPCVIVSWSAKFQKSDQWKTVHRKRKPKGVKQQDQAFYHILVKNAPSGFIGLNVAEGKLFSSHGSGFYYWSSRNGSVSVTFFCHLLLETLELPRDIGLAHEQLGSDFGGNGYFERFDGRRYVPNAELRERFPEDDKVALALTA